MLARGGPARWTPGPTRRAARRIGEILLGAGLEARDEGRARASLHRSSQVDAFGSDAPSGTSSSIRAPSVVGHPSASTPRPSAASQSVVALQEPNVDRGPRAIVLGAEAFIRDDAVAIRTQPGHERGMGGVARSGRRRRRSDAERPLGCEPCEIRHARRVGGARREPGRQQEIGRLEPGDRHQHDPARGSRLPQSLGTRRLGLLGAAQRGRSARTREGEEGPDPDQHANRPQSRLLVPTRVALPAPAPRGDHDTGHRDQHEDPLGPRRGSLFPAPPPPRQTIRCGHRPRSRLTSGASGSRPPASRSTDSRPRESTLMEPSSQFQEIDIRLPEPVHGLDHLRGVLGDPRMVADGRTGRDRVRALGSTSDLRRSADRDPLPRAD